MSNELGRFLFAAVSCGVALFGLIGCDAGRRNRVVPGQIVTNETSVAYADLPGEAELVCIATQVLTKAQVEARTERLYSEIRTTYTRPGEAKAIIDRLKGDVKARIVSEFVHDTVFSLEAAARGVQPTAEDLAVARDAILKQGGGQDIAAGDQERKIASTAAMRQLFQQVFSNALEVTEAEVEGLHAKLLAGNEEMVKTNKLLKAEMETLRTRIVKDKLVFTEDEDANAKFLREGMEVERFEAAPPNSFVDEEVIPDALRRLAFGQWTDVIELDDTFELYQVQTNIPKTAQHPTLWTGVRIHVEKHLGFHVPSKEELRMDIRNRKNVALVWPYTESLLKKYGTLYPHGCIWERSNQSRAKGKESKK